MHVKFAIDQPKAGTVTRHQREMSRSPCRSTGMGAVIPGDVLAAKIRTYLSHPVTWQPSADQRRLIGHMVLHKTDSAANGDLGLKVVGGRRSDTGRLGAFITRVKAGSVADTVGRLRAGDEVLEWNGQALQNATFDQVYEIISASKHESQVEIIVSRSSSVPGGDDFLNVQIPARQLPNPQYFLTDPDMYCSPSASPLVPYHALSHSQSAIIPQMQAQLSPRHRASMAGYYSDIGVPFVPELSYGRGQIFGRIELSLYFSHHDRQLTVTVERAIDLPPRPDGIPRNPYVKVFLLPDRRSVKGILLHEKSRRQTAVLAEALIPVWSESFFYPGITESMLMERVLEVTVWDYDKYEANSFLGETLVDFTAVPLDGQPLLYTLVDMDDENPLRTVRIFFVKKLNGISKAINTKQDIMYDMLYNIRKAKYIKLFTFLFFLSRLEEDWNINNQSGYLSDHGYSQQQPAPRYRQRRPRSATAMRPMTAAEMSASRMYNRNLPEQPYDESDGTPEARFPPSHLSSWFPPNDPRSPNGRLMMEAMQEQQGYGSDGSETMSTHSAHSMPVVRTINRRCPLPNGSSDLQETSLDNYITDDISAMNSGSTVKTSASSMNMEKRKKSMITRFIPGRGAGGADGKRTGFARSEEVGIPGNLSTDRLQTQIMKQASKDSTDSAHSDNWVPVLPDGPLGTFVDNLGPGQVVGRQVLASPVLGEIQIGIMAGRSGIDVEIIRAKNLVVKPGVKINPAPYVKVYLMEGKMCVAKAKTNPVRKTTAPLFQQHLIFNDTPKRKMLQITVLGDYGRMERKTFMGIAQIRLDDLELGPEPVIGWYKLYHSSSLAGTGPILVNSYSVAIVFCSKYALVLYFRIMKIYGPVLTCVFATFLSLLIKRKIDVGNNALDYLRLHATEVDISNLDVDKKLFKHALNISLNWLCNVHSFPTVLDRLIIFALDEITFISISNAWPTVHVFNWTIPSMAAQFRVGDGQYQMFQLFRSNLAAYIAKSGKDFWMLQPDTYWRENLFTVYDPTNHIGDILFDQEGDSGLLSKMIAGGNFFVRATNRAETFFNEVSSQLRVLYSTDNNIMGALCAGKYHGVHCSFIPYNIISNWRWHLGPRQSLPSLMQFDESGGGESKFARMLRLGARFAVLDGTGVCLQSSLLPRFAVSFGTLANHQLSNHSTQKAIQYTHQICEWLFLWFPSLGWVLRVHIFPYYAYFVIV
uniref:C2 domain-containing protein n=1 Tax=Heterorhabditis bacteriophora TaxID=37862 RepID=A0A1I7XH62_HETBA